MKLPSSSNPPIVIAIFLAGAMLFIPACDLSFDLDWDDFEIDWQTEIIRIDIDPNPVEIGQQVTFTCIIKDSTDSSFEFTWYIEPNHADTAYITSENIFTITAPDTAGSFTGSVEANNHDPDKVRAIRYFNYEVIEKENYFFPWSDSTS